MKFLVKFLFVFLTLAVAGGTAVAQEIIVGGTVTLKKKPEIARFNLSVAGRAESGDEAQSKMITSIAGVQDAIKKLGLEIYTIGYRIEPAYAEQVDPKTGRETQVVVGFIATTTYNVKVADLSKLPKALELTGLPGVSRASGLSFGLRDPEAAEREARAAAVEDAQANARAVMKAIVKGNEKATFEIVKIQQNSVQFNDPFRYLDLPRDSIVSSGSMAEEGEMMQGKMGGIGFGMGFRDSIIIPGEMEVTASVVMSVHIK